MHKVPAGDWLRDAAIYPTAGVAGEEYLTAARTNVAGSLTAESPETTPGSHQFCNLVSCIYFGHNF